jgi:hypothetical protein
VENVPNHHDISPRFGFAYDLFGTGRTAVKGSVGRYVGGGSFAQANNPVNTSVNSANRTWTDSNGDFWPQCDFSNTATNGECGPLSNLNFGKANPNATRFDPEVLNGWGKRLYNWEITAGFQHQLFAGLSLDATYYRRWYGNHTVTDNTEVTAADYNPFCVTAPTDPRLPVSGQQICGYQDVSPARFGRVSNYVTFAENFGGLTELYNGFDVSTTWRAPGGATLSGGLASGRTVHDACELRAQLPEATSPASSVTNALNPYCHVVPPFQTQLKFFGVYPLPWYGIQASATMQIVPGPSDGGTNSSITASYVATSAEIAPTLGRNLSSGANGTAIVELLEPFTLSGEYATQLDVRFAKLFEIGRSRVRATLDIYNVLNRNDIQTLQTRYGPAWQRPTLILQARYFQFGTTIDF